MNVNQMCSPIVASSHVEFCMHELTFTVLLNLMFVNCCNFNYCLQFLVSDTKYGEKLCNAANDAEDTPLHIASERGIQEAVNILLQHGACGSAQNSKLETPMHLAAGKGLEQ